MKKLLTLSVAVMLLIGSMGIGKAQAAIFDLNLNTLQDGWGNYENIYSISVEGFGAINQSFGDNYIFDDGDTFTEYAVFQKIGYKKSITGSTLGFSGLGDDYMLFAYAENLSGYATNFVGNAFNYVFNPGSKINIYVGAFLEDLAEAIDPTYLASVEKVAELNLIAGSGAGADGFLTGSPLTGSTRITTVMDYNETPAGVWLTDILGDLTQLSYPTQLILDTTNSIPGGVKYYDLQFNENQQLIGAGGFTATATSSGSVTVNPVPEPSTMLLLGLGFLGFAAVGRKQLR